MKINRNLKQLMRNASRLILLPLLMSCESDKIEPNHQKIEQGYIVGGISPFLNAQLTNDENNIYIETNKYNDRNGAYTFSFSWNHAATDITDYNLSLTLQVSINEPREGRTYQFTSTNSLDPAMNEIFCDIKLSDSQSNNNVRYTTLKDIGTIKMVINEVKPDQVTGVPIVTGTIIGDLFNPNDSEDSISLDLEFKTRNYKP